MHLNKQQKEIIWKTFKTLRNTSNQIGEVHDLWLSDVRDIESSFWDLYNNFDFIKTNCEKENK